jgi:Na+-driven multidrug efflux pump
MATWNYPAVPYRLVNGMKIEKSDLTIPVIFAFWLPLASTWFMMALEGPFLSAIIARLSEPKFNLAAYGVAFSLAILIESPVIMLMSASTALVKDWLSYKKLFRFTLALNIIITAGMLVLAIPHVFFFVGDTLIGLPKEVSHLTYYSIIFLIPWPAAIGFRRFYQGVLIYHKHTRRVAYGTVIRLVSMALTAFWLYKNMSLHGAYVGAIALSSGVCAEAVAVRIMVHGVLTKLKTVSSSDNQDNLTYRQIITFYTPLALTSILSLGAHPIITFFVGKSEMALESLAVIPVIGSFLFLFRSLGLSYQEAVIALIGNQCQKFRPIKNFALLLGFLLFVFFLLIIFTPLIRIWYHTISGLSQELTTFAIPATMVLFLMPFLEVWLSLQRGLQVSGRKTAPITIATAIELFGIIIVLFLCINVFNMIGAMAASMALLIGRVFANVYLFFPNYLLLRESNRNVEEK